MVSTLGFSVLNEYQLREAGAMPMTATINFLCEKHGKGRVDALFAWASMAKAKEAKKQMLVTLEDL
eukprot:12169909-Prorocentrum_lima.AAC.1